MFIQNDAFRVMAAKYLRLAKSTVDPKERSKFFDYAMIYAQLSEQAERRVMADLWDQNKQEDPAGSDSSRGFRAAQGH